MRTYSLALVAVMLFAGCVSGDDAPVETAQADPPSNAGESKAAAPAATSTTPQPAAASPAQPTAESSAEAEPAAPVTVPYQFAGDLGVGFCAPAGLNSCSGITFEGMTFDPTEIASIVSGSLTVTWEAATPATANLRFSVGAATSCGEGCWQGVDSLYEVIEGPSPLALTLPAATLGEGEILVVAVRFPRLTPEPIYGYAHPDQPFTVEGNFVVPPS